MAAAVSEIAHIEGAPLRYRLRNANPATILYLLSMWDNPVNETVVSAADRYHLGQEDRVGARAAAPIPSRARTVAWANQARICKAGPV